MTNKFRLSLGDEFFCHTRLQAKAGQEPRIKQAQDALRGLEISFEPAGPKVIVFETDIPMAQIKKAVGAVYSIYQLLPPRPLPQVSPSDFIP